MKKAVKVVIIVVVCLVVLIAAAAVFECNALLNSSIGRASIQGALPADSTVQAVMAYASDHTYDQTYITSDDGLKLFGRIYKTAATTSTWIITIHGYKSDSADILDRSEAFVNQGYNVLAPDMRAHGNSEGAFTGMGWLDRKDVLDWINYIIGLDPDAKIVLYGVSMGGATVMMTSGEDLPPNVVCAVEDCGYTSVHDEFSWQMTQQYSYLPHFPLFNIISLLSKMRAGYSFEEASSVDQLAKCKIPMLFIHGDADTYVPFYMLQQNYDADADPDKQMLVVPGAKHAESYTVAPELYWNTVFSFLNKYGAPGAVAIYD